MQPDGSNVIITGAGSGTGRCRAVRERGGPVDWHFPTRVDLARAEGAP